MCFCGLEVADVEISVTVPFLGAVRGLVGRRCAATGTHLLKMLVR